MNRAAIKADLERRRRLNIEARSLRRRLAQLTGERRALSMAMIAIRHGTTLAIVQAIAHGMAWTEEEKRAAAK